MGSANEITFYSVVAISGTRYFLCRSPKIVRDPAACIGRHKSDDVICGQVSSKHVKHFGDI
jgi:hypothetical protein